MNKKRKAVVMLSGGLDSALSAYLMNEAGVELTGVHFTSPFGSCVQKENALRTAQRLGFKFQEIPMGKEFLNIVAEPRYGYGKNMNPCVDCRIYCLRLAKKVMRDENADFIVTGEVVGQRPMSQTRRKLTLTEKDAGVERLVLRPLSAGRLQKTIPQEKGWVGEDNLLSISGRSRERQMKLAEKYGLSDSEYSSPAGGCKLTMKEYSEKLRDLIEHGCFRMKDVELLSRGRHFRLSPGCRLIVGKDQEENEFLDESAPPESVKIKAAREKGPLAILLGDCARENILTAAGICGRYSDADFGKKIDFEIIKGKKIEDYRGCRCFYPQEVDKFRV